MWFNENIRSDQVILYGNCVGDEMLCCKCVGDIGCVVRLLPMVESRKIKLMMYS